MHFFKNSVSFMAIMCVIGGACAAASSRVSVTPTAATAASSRRLASIGNVVKKTAAGSVAATTTASTSQSSTSSFSDSECIDEYRECMKSDTACGSDFEECTTNVLFHGHMGECFGTLYQCSGNAIKSLFGTSDISALSNVDSYVSGTNNTEVARYKYPTDGSVMGIDIIGASTRNKLSTADCVKKYKSCLNKDNVCGNDFELCTSDSEFKKLAVLCDSTLARCQKEGFQELFGEAVTTKPSNKKLIPKADGTVHKWIEDGATLAAANAVNTCYKVVDNCFLNACAKNPYRCVEGVSFDLLNAADFVSDQTLALSADNNSGISTEAQSSSDVRKFFRAACEDTIGANKYCYMTFKEKTPSKKDLTDSDTREEIFDEAYTTRNRRDILGVKITDVVQKFDANAKNKCIDTFKSCAIRSCGGGSGAACYARVFGNHDTRGSINKAGAYNDILRGCAAVVNTDVNCKYMAATINASDNTYNYTFSDDQAFGILFPAYDASQANDVSSPVVAALNADLSTAYNEAAIEKMKKQCSNVITNCVKSMCGKEYQNCYRNRNDIRLSTYQTNSDNFNRSMNKVGGVLDYTIVQGLCMNTVKNADACNESLAIAKLGVRDSSGDVTGTWGNNLTTTSNAWRASSENYGSNIIMTDMIQATDANGKKLCTCSNGGTGICAEEELGDINCTTAYMIERDVQLSNTAATSLFQTVLADIELEAQAQYNAKLTKEQHVCLAQNTGASPNATFVWAKLKGKLKKDYASMGLGETGSVASNDLYNSFCRVKVTLQSEDREVQQTLAGVSNAYFSTGDAITCGSWISDADLKTITDKVGERARKEAGEGSQKDKNWRVWTTVASVVGGGVLGGVAMDKLQQSDGLGGLLNKNLKKVNSGEQCTDLVSQARTKYDEAIRTKNQKKMDEAVRAANQAKNKLASIDKSKTTKIEIPTSVTLETYNTDKVLTPAQAAVKAQAARAAQDAEYGIESSSLNAVSDARGIAEGLCRINPDGNPNDYDGCVTAANNIADRLRAIVDVKYTSAQYVAIDDIKSWFSTMVSHMKNLWDSNDGAQTRHYNKNADYKRQVDDLETTVNKLQPIKVIKVKDAAPAQEAIAGKEAVAAVYEQAQRFNEKQQKALDKAFAQLEDACDVNNSEDGDSISDKAAKQRVLLDAAGAAVGATTTGILANQIVRTTQKAKYESAENEAVKEWMNNIGSKIHCYIGGEKAGDYGDIIKVDIEED